MLVRKTIFGGIVTLDGNVYVTGGAYGIITDGPSQIGGTLQVIGDQWNFAALRVDGVLDLNAQFDVDIGANTEFDINDDLFRFTDGTNTLRVDSFNGIQLLGNTGVGDSAHADYTFYVDENAVNGQIALFKTFFSGPATVDIDSRIAEDPQLRFLVNGSVGWIVGVDGAGDDFVITQTEGEFSAANDKLRLTGSTHYLYGDGSTTFILATRGATSDVGVFFRQDGSTRYVIGFDHSDNVFKLGYSSTLAFANNIHLLNDDTVKLPSLAGGGVQPVYVDNDGLLTGVDDSITYIDVNPGAGTVNHTPTVAYPNYHLQVTQAGGLVTGTIQLDLDAVEAAGRDMYVNVFLKVTNNSPSRIDVDIRDSGNTDIVRFHIDTSSVTRRYYWKLFWNDEASEWKILESTNADTLLPPLVVNAS